MALIHIEFDTVSKAMSVSLDGTVVPDVIEATVGRSWDNPKEFSCSMVTKKKDETNDMVTFTQVMAEHSLGHKAAARVKKCDLPGFVADAVSCSVASEDSLADDVAKYFGKE